VRVSAATFVTVKIHEIVGRGRYFISPFTLPSSPQVESKQIYYPLPVVLYRGRKGDMASTW